MAMTVRLRYSAYNTGPRVKQARDGRRYFSGAGFLWGVDESVFTSSEEEIKQNNQENIE
jgi:hypothetical protein